MAFRVREYGVGNTIPRGMKERKQHAKRFFVAEMRLRLNLTGRSSGSEARRVEVNGLAMEAAADI